MKNTLIALTLGLSLSAQAAAPLKRMFFFCSGNDKSSTALQIGTDSYFNGQIQGVTLKIKEFYSDYNDEELKDPRMVVAKQAKYTPRNPELVGLDKFIIKSAKGAEIALIIPNRTELEKQWMGVSDSWGKVKHNEFKGYVQMHDQSGDNFLTLEVECNLNWKPSN